MRLPVWKQKTMLAQAIAGQSPERAQETVRRDIFVRLIEQYEPALRRLASGYAERAADREDLFQEFASGLKDFDLQRLGTTRRSVETASTFQGHNS